MMKFTINSFISLSLCWSTKILCDPYLWLFEIFWNIKIGIESANIWIWICRWVHFVVTYTIKSISSEIGIKIPFREVSTVFFSCWGFSSTCMSFILQYQNKSPITVNILYIIFRLDMTDKWQWCVFLFQQPQLNLWKTSSIPLCWWFSMLIDWHLG